MSLRIKDHMRKHGAKHLMMLPAILITFVFSYVPMVGIVMAFQRYSPKFGFFGSKWVGWKNFETLFTLPDFKRILINTIEISAMKMVAGIVFPLIFALCMHEIRKKWFKSTVQTATLFPHFISWVILGSIFLSVFDIEGLVNQALMGLGIPAVEFLTDDSWFRAVLVSTDVWKGFAYNSIIYMSALSGIDTSLYEASYIDGAGRWKAMLHISIPCIGQIIAMTAILSMGGILSAGFDQVYNLYNPTVMDTADILDTYVYRVGLNGQQYGLGTAVGLFKSIVGAILFAITNWFADYRIL